MLGTLPQDFTLLDLMDHSVDRCPAFGIPDPFRCAFPRVCPLAYEIRQTVNPGDSYYDFSNLLPGRCAVHRRKECPLDERAVELALASLPS